MRLFIRLVEVVDLWVVIMDGHAVDQQVTLMVDLVSMEVVMVVIAHLVNLVLVLVVILVDLM